MYWEIREFEFGMVINISRCSDELYFSVSINLGIVESKSVMCGKAMLYFCTVIIGLLLCKLLCVKNTHLHYCIYFVWERLGLCETIVYFCINLI